MRGILGIVIILGSCGLGAYLDLGLGVQQVVTYYTIGVLGGALGVMVILVREGSINISITDKEIGR